MLFFLNRKLLSDLNSPDRKEVIMRAINNVLRSAWESNHLVHADLDSVQIMRKKINNTDCLNVLIFIDCNYSLLDYESLKFYVDVVPEKDVMRVEDIDGVSILHLSVDYLQKTDILQKTVVLCEADTDADFFAKICRYYQKQNSVHNINIEYASEHGAGNQICHLYKKHINNKNKFCLTFCDNDKHYPTCAPGSTLNALNEIDRNGNFLCDKYILEVSEIENLIPLNYLSVNNSMGIKSIGVDFINRIKGTDASVHLKYYDFKKNITKKRIKDNPDFISFIEKIIPYCEEQDALRRMEDLQDDSIIVPSVGKVMLQVNGDEELFNNNDTILLDFQKNEWDKIGEKFFNWTCARNNESINM